MPMARSMRVRRRRPSQAEHGAVPKWPWCGDVSPVRGAGVERKNLWSSLDIAIMVLPPCRCDIDAPCDCGMVPWPVFLAYCCQLSDWVCQVKIPERDVKNVAGIKACMPQSLSQRMV